MQTVNGPQSRQIAVFGFDVTEASQVRRIRRMISIGHQVTSYTMRRNAMMPDFKPEWPNRHLATIPHQNLYWRMLVIAFVTIKLFWFRRELRKSELFWARNLDMLLIAWIARKISRRQDVPLVYECLDIHQALTRDSIRARMFRAVERHLLDQTALLVVSSPAFISAYFQTLQNYSGRWCLLENKLSSPDRSLPSRPKKPGVRPEVSAFRLGWVGTLRCAPSLALLLETAQQLGNRIEVHLHGIVHKHALPELQATLKTRANLIFHGAYSYPSGLLDIYQRCDAVWAQDLWQSGGNSEWLLPNRLYEAGWAGCPSIAVKGTETGRKVAQDRLGWVIDAPAAHDLSALIRGLTSAEIQSARTQILRMSDRAFEEKDRDLQHILATAFNPTDAAVKT